jgi:hypothetical protein
MLLVRCLAPLAAAVRAQRDGQRARWSADGGRRGRDSGAARAGPAARSSSRRLCCDPPSRKSLRRAWLCAALSTRASVVQQPAELSLLWARPALLRCTRTRAGPCAARGLSRARAFGSNVEGKFAVSAPRRPLRRPLASSQQRHRPMQLPRTPASASSAPALPLARAVRASRVTRARARALDSPLPPRPARGCLRLSVLPPAALLLLLPPAEAAAAAAAAPCRFLGGMEGLAEQLARG